jgi:hypothetical protein
VGSPSFLSARWPEYVCQLASPSPQRTRKSVNEETLNISIRKFLKMVGVSSQREIEHAVEHAVAAGASAPASFPATMTLEIPGLKLRVVFDGQIDLG